MNVSVVLFPGSNCDHDVIYLYESVLGQRVSVIWHQDTDLKQPDLVILPGGFSYGDYLRTGALAKISPVMAEVRKFADKGGPVIGICNGFQILCEAQLLPGVLLANTHLKFLSRFVTVKVERTDTPFTRNFKAGELISCPVAHFEGNYFAAPETIKQLEDNGQVVFRYCNEHAQVDPQNLAWNPNGATNAIAGICNKQRNVIGLMPHPERAAQRIVGFIGGESGKRVFESVLNAA